MDLLEFIKEFISIYIEMVPYLAFGLLVAGILKVFVKSSSIIKHLGGKGLSSVIKSAFFGVPLPLCSCSVVPTAISLKERGASNGAVLSFLIATPQTGVESIVATWGMMGSFFAIFRPFAAFITGIIGGSLASGTGDSVTKSVKSNYDESINISISDKIKNIFTYGFGELMDDIGINLIIGILISTVITIFIPDSIFSSFTQNPILEMLVILLGAIPLYVCATASVPIAAALLIKGVSPGAAFLFLMAGPATNAATISVIFSKLGKKMGGLYLTTIIVSSVLLGTLLNFGYGALNIDPVEGLKVINHSMSDSSLWQTILTSLFTFALIKSVWSSKIKVPFIMLFKRKKEDNNIVRVYKVGGMTCQNCANHVKEAVLVLNDAFDANINLDKMELTVVGDISSDTVKKAVNNAGYSFDSVDRGNDITREFSVPTMTCKNCVNHVESVVKILDGIESVEVNLDEKKLYIKGIVSDEVVINTVEDVGYKITRL